MAEVTGLTADRMIQIEDASVVSGLVDANGDLILSTHGGSTSNAGHVVGPQGPIGDSTIPAGTISLWASDTPPSNWLICDGSPVSRTTYASLFAVIGVKYGSGDGSTTFNLPNLKGRTPVGKDSAQTEFANLSQTGGEKTHKLTAAESGTPSHTHKIGHGGAGSDGAIYGGGTDSVTFGYSPAQINGAGGVYQFTALGNTAADAASAHNNLQPYEVVNFIIKYTNGDTPSDSQLTDRVSALENGGSQSELIDRKISNLQRVLTGGGVRKVTSTGVAWTRSFVAVGVGRDSLSPSGYFEISFPANGIVIPVHFAQNGVTSVTVANSQLPLSGWQALYYEAPLGQPYNPTNNFHIVDYTADQSFTVPDNWILICARNNDGLSIAYTWGDGRSQDYWKDLTLQNSWVNYDSAKAFAWAGWKICGDGDIKLRGLIMHGTTTINTIIASLPADVAPASTAIFIQDAGAGVCRLDVTSAGNLQFEQFLATAGTSDYVSLEGIRWSPRDN